MYSQNTQIFRRDIVFSVNYATSQTVSAPQVVAPVISINDYTQPL
jgi:ribosomal protein S24E